MPERGSPIDDYQVKLGNKDNHLQPQMVEHSNLDQGLVVEPLLVADDLDGHLAPGAVVQRPDHLPEGALADHLEDLVPVRYVVVNLLWKIQKNVINILTQDCIGTVITETD